MDFERIQQIYDTYNSKSSNTNDNQSYAYSQIQFQFSIVFIPRHTFCLSKSRGLLGPEGVPTPNVWPVAGLQPGTSEAQPLPIATRALKRYELALT